MTSSTARGLIVGAALAAILFACAASPPAVNTPLVTECSGPPSGDRTSVAALVGQEYGLRMTPIPLNSVQFSEWSTPSMLAVQHLYAARTPTDTVQVTARFVSCSDAAFSIRVRTSFLGADQAPSEDPSAWQTVFLEPHLTAVYSERSTSKAVTHYLIEVIPGS
jgi:hypothetical protein